MHTYARARIQDLFQDPTIIYNTFTRVSQYEYTNLYKQMVEPKSHACDYLLPENIFIIFCSHAFITRVIKQRHTPRVCSVPED